MISKGIALCTILIIVLLGSDEEEFPESAAWLKGLERQRERFGRIFMD